MMRWWRSCDDWLWWLAPTAVCVIACWVFVAAPAVILKREIVLDSAYLLKAESPLADTSKLPMTEAVGLGQWSHGAKLTRRIVPSYLLAFATRLQWHPYMPSLLGGIALLGAVVLTGERISKDREFGLLLGLATAGLFTSAQCFAAATSYKPFDGVAYGAVAVLMLAAASGSLLTVLCAVLALWCDERSLISIVLLIPLVQWQPNFSPSRRLVTNVSLLAGVILYLISRAIIGTAAGWSPTDLSYLGSSVLKHTMVFALYLPCMAWKGALWPILLLMGALARQQRWLAFASLGLAILGSLASCLIVLDMSRAAGFLFVLIPAAFAGLQQCGWSDSERRKLISMCAVMSLLSPSCDLVASMQGKAHLSWLSILLRDAVTFGL